MLIKDRIEFKNKPPALTFAADDIVLNAVKVMAEKNYGACVIVDETNKPIGILTERDLMRRLLAPELDPSKTRISQIMTTQLKVASENDNVIDWLRIMSNERFRHLPVVDANGKLSNIMSQGDFVSYTWPQLLHKIKDEAVQSFIKRHELFILVGGIMIYFTVMLVMVISIK